MNNLPSRPMLSRRNFFKLLAAVGVTTVGAYALIEVAPWLDYEAQVNHIRRPLERNVTLSAQIRELIRYATLAANGHNTQPWQFALTEDAIEIHPDYTRRLPVVDPDDRELWISLGCALENFLIAARAAGYAAEVTYPETADTIRVRLTADTSQNSPLFKAIEHRQNTRSEYDGQPVKATDLDTVQALPLEPGVALRYVLNPSELETVLEYVNQGNLRQYADHAFVDELITWLRFNKKEAIASCDGLFSRCSGNPEVPGWLGRMFVAGTKPQQQADIDAKKLRSSSGAVVITSETDDKATWVRTGQVYERLALKLTALNIKSAFLNQSIEVADLRLQLQSALGLGGSSPQLLLRFGYADAMPRSLRRPVDQVIITSGRNQS
ncbi:MAG: Tat pathway signal protein [Anaerolineae bacterium]|nr:Tat pathway signal protein [Anaerolineae bacterium]